MFPLRFLFYEEFGFTGNTGDMGTRNGVTFGINPEAGFWIDSDLLPVVKVH